MFVKLMKKNKRLYRRLFAYIIDWYLGSLLAMSPFLIIAMANGVSYQNIFQFQLFTQQEIGVGLLVSLSLSFIYFFVVPWKCYNGQTVGKKIMNLKIVGKNNDSLDMKALLMRQIFMIWFVEISLHSIGGILINSLVCFTGFDRVIYFIDLGRYLTMISVLMIVISTQHISLHDFLTNTKVIDLKYE